MGSQSRNSDNQASGRRSVLITGGATGIGFGIAEHFARRGERVAILDIDADATSMAAQRLRKSGYEVLDIVGDVTNSTDVSGAIDEVLEAYNVLDIVVSNVGADFGSPVLELTEREWDFLIALNLKGTFLVTQAAARQMVKQGGGGRICCIGSQSGRAARRGAAAYCASKAGLEMFSNVLAMELAPHQITVNVVVPGFVDRESPGEAAWVTDEYREQITKSIPLGRIATSSDVASVVEFLCSERAAYITGQSIAADGGASAGRFHLPMSSTPFPAFTTDVPD